RASLRRVGRGAGRNQTARTGERPRSHRKARFAEESGEPRGLGGSACHPVASQRRRGMKGKVYLVGAGPGDPELLTLKALRLLQAADAVLHDELVSPEILSLVAPAARLQNVGKRCGIKKITQDEINFLLVALAGTGLQIVRLKAGDPLIFGRGG